MPPLFLLTGIKANDSFSSLIFIINLILLL